LGGMQTSVGFVFYGVLMVLGGGGGGGGAGRAPGTRSGPGRRGKKSVDLEVDFNLIVGPLSS
ncbi:hypothetical protein, partial [Pseudomonas aeruginosa]|uniref:hypothetical protein n=1 Tax=Pseudomonas aeruginosa TaxID=287 RepID=UPI0039BE19A7